MNKTILLCIGLALSTSACGDETVVGGPGLPDAATDDGSDLPTPDDGADSDGSETGTSLPDLGADEPDPDPGRVFTAFEDGDDDIFLATVGDDVLDHYPDADHWAIRVTPSGTAIGLLLNANGQKLDIVRVRPEAPLFFEGQPDTRQVCFPDILDLTGPICVTEPCDFEDDPKGGELPDCIETAAGSDGEHITVMGSVDGVAIGRIVTQDGTSDLNGIELGAVQLARMAVVGDLLDDLQAIVPDMEPLGPSCLDCWWNEFVFGANLAACAASVLACPSLLPQIEGLLECQKVEC
jgi:hypothetical protein